MNTLRDMDAQAQTSPFEQLTALLEEREHQAAEWNEKLPMLRARTAATGVVLDGLAQTWPTDPPPRRTYADVVLAAPSKQWAEDVATRLRDELTSEAQVDFGAPGEGLRDSQPLTGFTVRCQISLPGMPGAKATERVRAALAKMKGLAVDYSESLNLIVVYPSG